MFSSLRTAIHSAGHLWASSSQACSCTASSIPVASTITWTGRLLDFATAARQFSTSSALHKIKMKTHKGTAKRWAALPSGQYKRGRPGKRHLNVTLSGERLNRLGHTGYATPAQVKALKRLLPGQ